MSNFIIKQASLSQMNELLALAEAEGWNPGISDAVPFFYTDPKGFFIGELDGQMIGCISAVAYNSDYGFMGFYIILPKYRGRGFGIKLWQHAISYLEDRAIGLDGVVAQQENYKKSGFRLFYNNIRFGGKVEGRAADGLTPIGDIPFQALLAYDTSIFGINRENFLRRWIEMPSAYGLAKVVGNQVVGYGVIRRCVKGHKIGPLYAADRSIANAIFLDLLEKSGASEVFLDVPELNNEAMLLAREHNLTTCFETARMYKGNPPIQDLNKVFGVTTFELG